MQLVKDRYLSASIGVGAVLGVWLCLGVAAAAPSSRPAARAHPQVGAAQIPGLLQELRSPKPKLRVKAAKALGFAKVQAPKITQALVKALNDQVLQVRWAAATSLRRLGPKSAQALLGAVQQKTMLKWRLRALRVLDMICKGAKTITPAMLQVLRDKHPRIRRDVARWLGACGGPASVTIPALVTALGDHHWRVGLEASQALRSKGALALPALEKALEKPLLSLRAAKTLADLKAKGVPVLCRALLARAWQARYAATYGLGAWKPRKIPCLAILLKGLSSPAWQLRALTAQTIAKTRKKTPLTLASLQLALRDKAWQVRRQAAYGLLVLGQRQPHMLPPILKALEGKHPQASREAAHALALLGALSILPLRKRLTDKRNYVRHAAAYALALSQDPTLLQALPDLHKACKDKNKGVRIVALYALQKAAKHKDKKVQAAAKVLLQKLPKPRPRPKATKRPTPTKAPTARRTAPKARK